MGVKKTAGEALIATDASKIVGQAEVRGRVD
jgi:hypothetical protein